MRVVPAPRLTLCDLQHWVAQVETELHHTQVPQQLAHLRPIQKSLCAPDTKDDVHGAPAGSRPGGADGDIQDLKEGKLPRTLRHFFTACLHSFLIRSLAEFFFF